MNILNKMRKVTKEYGKNEITMLYNLEKRLTKLDDSSIRNIAFIIMKDEENGFNICYRKNMPVEETGSRDMFYIKNSVLFDEKNKAIKWPYTGFVEGNILSWCPISIRDLSRLLKKYGYKVENFYNELIKQAGE